MSRLVIVATNPAALSPSSAQFTHHVRNAAAAIDVQDSISGFDDSALFAGVVMPHLDAAYNLAYWLTRNRTDAEDVVQDASLRAFRGIRGFVGGSARAWVLRIVRNTAYSWLHENHPSAVITVEDLEVVEAAHAKPSDPDAKVPIGTVMSRLARARGRLIATIGGKKPD
jgi:DNA-directed RNA polymerase specialized sigma24 family protein